MGFYDPKGYWRSDGDGFYDFKGNWVSPGGAFYDYKGYLRNPGEGFYDSHGDWVSPGQAFHDGRGNLQAWSDGAAMTGGGSAGVVVTVGFLLFLPVLIVWSLVALAIEWAARHLYLVFFAYLVLDAAVSFMIIKRKKLRRGKACLSFFGNFMCFLALLYIVLAYAIPYVTLRGSSMGSLFEFTLALGVGAGAAAILYRFNDYHGSALLECICGGVFLALVLLLIRFGVSDYHSIGELAAVYHQEADRLFVLLFGFMV